MMVVEEHTRIEDDVDSVRMRRVSGPLLFCYSFWERGLRVVLYLRLRRHGIQEIAKADPISNILDDQIPSLASEESSPEVRLAKGEIDEL
jgi:hypothetical protein